MTPAEKQKIRLKAEVFKALGNPVRLAILEYLLGGERCVQEIVEHVGTDVSNVSKHLSILRRQGLVADRKEGLKIFYRQTVPCAFDFGRCAEVVVIGRLEEQRLAVAGDLEPASENGEHKLGVGVSPV